MSQENVEIVRETYAEWQRGNMKAGVGSDSIPRSSFESFMPDARERIVANGPAEVEAFMREFLRDWRGYRLIGDEYRRASATRVFVRARPSAVGRGFFGLDLPRSQGCSPDLRP